ncbi:MAG: hypothetical protein JW819_13380 [Candidatus Krumholzibacteriota bacterium]|nr:hypothetical protein [Candidatus Krumholzibacteriota bacterium]
MKKWLLTILVLAVAAPPAMAYEVVWDGPADGELDINLQVDCYIQIDWQDTAIDFDGTSDWWSTQLMGLAYQSCPDDGGKFAPDPWAGDAYYAGGNGRYYESGDGAVIFVRSNNDLSMAVHTNGDLYGTVNSASNTIPTWFTVCLCPFWINGVQLSGHTIPNTTNPGCYLSDINPADFHYEYCEAGMGWPAQQAFACAPASNTYTLGSMAPYIEGSIKFLARIWRNGLQDPGDQYYTMLDVHFTTP